MSEEDYREPFRDRWRGILTHFGLSRNLLDGRPGPCPFCGGRDRFQFRNYQGNGGFICRKCGNGDGFEFVKRARGVDFKEALRMVEEVSKNIGPAKFAVKSGEESYRLAMNSIWAGTEPVSQGCPVWLYLERRLGPLRAVSGQIRYHQELAYSPDGGIKSFHPAMVALVTDINGNPVNFHRTYLTRDGQKADVPCPKKLCAGTVPKGSAIRLTPVCEELGIAEGIETALAVTEFTGISCWAAVSSYGLSTWEPPAKVKHVLIFGDHDKKFGGQAAAYALAHRLACNEKCPVYVGVKIPRSSGDDWADVLKEGGGVRHAS